MAVKTVVATKAEIPSGMEAEYKEKDGKFYLDLDGDVVPKDQLVEFRNNNIALLKDKEKLVSDLKKFDGIDLDNVNKALALQQKIDDQKLIDTGKVDELVDQKVSRMREDFEGKSKVLTESVTALTTKNEALSNKLSTVLIDSQIHAAVNELGKPRAGAMEDILNRGRSLYQLRDGVPTPIGSDGNPVYGKDGKAVMTFTEWAAGLIENSGYLFESASGGGANGNNNKTNQNHNAATIQSGDPIAFGQNLEDIATGKVVVK